MVNVKQSPSKNPEKLSDCDTKSSESTPIPADINNEWDTTVHSQGVSIQAPELEKIIRTEANRLNADAAVTKLPYFHNSLALVDGYSQIHQQQLCWRYVMSGERQIPYAVHEDELILWCQSQSDIPKNLYDKRGVGAAYRSVQRREYQRLVADVATLLCSKGDERYNWTDFFEQIGLSEVEQLVMLWWMSHRKTVLVQLAKGESISKLQPPMPVFYSPKGDTGKSYIVNKLCEPFGDLADVKCVSDIEDKFSQGQWAQLLIGNFDEMAGLGKTDVRVFKQWMTKSRFSARKMQSQLVEQFEKITAGIGSSNEPLAEILNDTTGGARRLFDIAAPDDGRLIRLANEYDFISLWQSIPLDINPTPEERTLIHQQQNLQRKQHVVELWYADVGKTELSTKPLGYPALELFQHFTAWCHSNCEDVVTNTMFGRKLIDCYGDTVAKSRNTIGVTYQIKQAV